MIRNLFTDEQRLSLSRARHHPLFRKDDGASPDLSSIFRWAMKGVRGVKLRVTRVGGRIYTTERDIAEFVAALNQGNSESGVSGNRRREIGAARQRLAREGVQ